MSPPGLTFLDVGAPSSAPPIVLVHAFPLDRRMWRPQLDAAARTGVRAIAPDLRGFGASGHLSPPTSIADHAADVVALLDALSVARAKLVGLSMGGYVALAIARAFPERLAGLVLVDTKATADGPEARLGRAATLELCRARGPSAVFDAMADKALSPSSPPSVRAGLREIAGSQTTEGIAAAIIALRDRPDATDVLPRISVPATIVVGRDDRVTPLADAEAMVDAIAGARLVVLDGAGHFPCVEQPELLWSAIIG